MERALRFDSTSERIALLAVTVLFVVVTFRASFSSMWELWKTSDYMHGLLVFPISALLVWRLRKEIDGQVIKTDLRVLILLVPLIGVWLVARIAGIQVVEHASVLALIPATVCAVFGWAATKRVWFPLAFLLMATPFGEEVVPWLMVVTADIATIMLDLSGISYDRDGQNISLPGGDFVVADVCSGVRYLTTGLLVALLFGYLNFNGFAKRAVFAVVVAAVLVLGNGFRAYVVMVIASATDMAVFAGRDHVYFGWIMFAVIMMVVVWAGSRLSDDPAGSDNRARSMGSAADVRSKPAVIWLIAASGLVMLASTLKPLEGDIGRAVVLLAIVFVLLVLVRVLGNGHVQADEGGPAESASADHKYSPSQTASAVVILAFLASGATYAAYLEESIVGTLDLAVDLDEVESCAPTGEWTSAWRPYFKDPDFTTSRTFDCAGRAVNVYVAAFAKTRQGNELVSAAHRVIPTEWVQWSSTTRSEIDVPDRGDMEVAEVSVIGAGPSRLVWYWYDVNGRTSVAPLSTKFHQVLGLLSGRPSGGHVVVISTPDAADVDAARGQLRKIAQELVKDIRASAGQG